MDPEAITLLYSRTVDRNDVVHNSMKDGVAKMKEKSDANLLRWFLDSLDEIVTQLQSIIEGIIIDVDADPSTITLIKWVENLIKLSSQKHKVAQQIRNTYEIENKAIESRAFDNRVRLQQKLQQYYRGEIEEETATTASVPDLEQFEDEHVSDISENTSEDVNGHRGRNGDVDHVQRTAHECQDCGRYFESGQALGGHRSKCAVKQVTTDLPSVQSVASRVDTVHLQQNNSVATAPSSGKDSSTSDPLNVQNRTQDSYYPKPLMQCPHCPKKCKNKKQLEQHIRTHTNEKPFKCAACGFRCSVKCNLTRHLETHSKESFACSFCCAVFKHRWNYDQHINQHTKKKAYKCEHCTKVFYTSAERSKHRNRFHGLKCKWCSQRFEKKEQLKNHKSEEHKNIKTLLDYECEKCHLRFATNEECDAHHSQCTEEPEDVSNELDKILDRKNAKHKLREQPEEHQPQNRKRKRSHLDDEEYFPTTSRKKRKIQHHHKNAVNDVKTKKTNVKRIKLFSSQKKKCVTGKS